MMARGTDVTDMKRKYRTATEGQLGDKAYLTLRKECDLRYGENPNQSAAMYRIAGNPLGEFTNIRLLRSAKGGLSATNFMDVARAMDVLKFFDVPAVAVMKHLIPSGFARENDGNSLTNLYEAARDADARSAFGSMVVFNRPVDKTTAHAIVSTYVEGVAAPDFEVGVPNILESKKDLRLIQFNFLDDLPRFSGDDPVGEFEPKFLPTGRVLIQQKYMSSIKGPDDLVTDPLVRKKGDEYVVQRDPTQGELQDMLTAWYVNIGVRSNGIVIVRDGVTLAVGSGQQERVGAVEQAIIKAYQKAMDREGIEYNSVDGAHSRDELSMNPLEGAVVSSDAFFPFRDSIDTLAEHGVTGVIQPGGSVRDYEVIQAVNEHNMAMAYTLERCFGHF
ncbi:MAG: IMP cyclohydrolase [Nanoarchaeota archaeon]|nr:IMP cyclohydrolase [Nanoarchaeota archaeon]